MKPVKTIFFAVLLSLFSTTVLACGGEASGHHFGKVVSVQKNKFTIQDMETRAAITFNANEKIIAGVGKISGMPVKVNYEENDEGALNAVGVTPI